MSPSRAVARLTFYPTLGFSRLMCALGVWRRWDWIDEWVALGALPSRRDLRRLHEQGVRTVVNLCAEFAGDADALRSLNVQQLHLPTHDYEAPSLNDLRRGVAFTRAQAGAGHKTLLHCKAGQGRSATLALCYLMATYGLTAEAAEARLRRARPYVDRGLARRAVVREFAREMGAGSAP